jgi:hypothetical protein
MKRFASGRKRIDSGITVLDRGLGISDLKSAEAHTGIMNEEIDRMHSIPGFAPPEFRI